MLCLNRRKIINRKIQSGGQVRVIRTVEHVSSICQTTDFISPSKNIENTFVVVVAKSDDHVYYISFDIGDGLACELMASNVSSIV